MLQQLLLAIHVLLAIGITVFVLLQRGKGADAGAGFGAGASGTVFGARGSSTFFSKTTAVLATCFFITSLWLAYLASHRTNVSHSLLDQAPVSAPAPSTGPGTAAPAPSPAPPASAPASTPAPAPTAPAPTGR
jgi:preprotein translocase subunit SecG